MVATLLALSLARPVQVAVLVRRSSDLPIPVVRRYWAAPARGYDNRQLAILTQGRGVRTYASQNEMGLALTVDRSSVQDAVGYIERKLQDTPLRPEEEAEIWGDDAPSPAQRRGLRAEIIATTKLERRAIGISDASFEKAAESRVPMKPLSTPVKGLADAALAASMLAAGKGSVLYRTLRFRDGYAYRPEATLTPVPGGAWTVSVSALASPGRPRPSLESEDITARDVARARAVLEVASRRGGPFHPYPFSPFDEAGTFRAWVRLWTGEPYSETAFFAAISSEAVAISAISLAKSALYSWSRAQRG